jgi:membrane associated rhomboid family serine protease
VSGERELIFPMRTTRERGAAEGWALVLASAGVSSRIESTRGTWELWVAEEDVARAREQLDAYDRENVVRPVKPAPPVAEYGPSYGGYVVAAALLAFFGLTGPFAAGNAWHAAGAADSAAVLGGEPWRVVTALTLHSDAAHVLANAVSAAVFVTLVFRGLGPGVGGALVLVSGAAGNLLNAWLQDAGHVSVGASTALFGAIGILCGLQFARIRFIRLRRRGAWLPLAAGLGLLAMLGTAGERTDVSAHALGLLCGLPLGALASLLPRPAAWPVQLALALASLAVLRWAWALAFSAS